MARSFCTDFQKDIVPHIDEAEMRFRKPYDSNPEQCRLWPLPDSRAKGQYQEIKITKDKVWETIRVIVGCPVISEKGECWHWGWCRQLQYDDTKITHTSL